MAKDYAKKNKGRKKPGASRGNESAVSKTMVLFVMLLVSGLITLLVYLKWYMPEKKSDGKPAPTISTTKTKPPTSNNATKTEEKQLKKQAEESDIPFYKTHEEIVNKKVEIPIEDLKLPENANKFVYLMPCGSFRDMARAEELKAQIAFVGYESKVNQVDVESGTWYRVELGPFSSKRKAESIRHRLQDNGHNYCKIWPKKVS